MSLDFIRPESRPVHSTVPPTAMSAPARPGAAKIDGLPGDPRSSLFGRKLRWTGKFAHVGAARFRAPRILKQVQLALASGKKVKIPPSPANFAASLS